jgi:hypothetical protein
MSEEAAPAESGQGEATSQEAPAPAPAPAPTSEAAPADAPFYASFEDEGLRGFVENKGVKKPEQLASMYHNLEKVVGADKAGRTVVMPGPDADEAAMSEFYGKLGRPEAADGYDLPVPEGDDGAMAEWAKGVFHGAGLTAKQATAVAEAWNSHMKGMQQAHQEQSQQTAAEAEAELKREWGAAYDRKIEGVERAAQALSISDDELAGLRSSMGPAGAMRFVDRLAVKLGEDVVIDGDAVGGALTPQTASAEIQKLGMDSEFMKAWMDKAHPSHQWAVQHKANLARMAAGHPPQQ